MSIVKNITSVDNLDWREIVINWEGMGDDVTEIKAGTPMDADGNIANNSNCFGLMMGDVLRTRSRARVVVSGPVDLDEAEANSGITLSDEAKSAMRDVWFPGKSGGGLPTGGAPYQQLVTDGEGNAKWEDRLAYDDSLLIVPATQGLEYVRVSETVPTWVEPGVTCLAYKGNNILDLVCSPLAEGAIGTEEVIFVLAEGGVTVEGLNAEFPSKGVYFLDYSERIERISRKGSTDPDITWDGSRVIIKKIEEKFISSMTSVVLKSSTSGSSKKFKITVDDSGTISATEVTT